MQNDRLAQLLRNADIANAAHTAEAASPVQIAANVRRRHVRRRQLRAAGSLVATFAIAATVGVALMRSPQPPKIAASSVDAQQVLAELSQQAELHQRSADLLNAAMSVTAKPRPAVDVLDQLQ